MKGSYKIVIKSERVIYNFEIRRNITVIKGDSGTGKTTLINMLKQAEDEDGRPNKSVEVLCDKPCIAYSSEINKIWKIVLLEVKESILFFDEKCHFITSEEFARFVKQSDNYFVLITRESLYELTYSVQEIYGIKGNQHGNIGHYYNEFYRLTDRH